MQSKSKHNQNPHANTDDVGTDATVNSLMDKIEKYASAMNYAITDGNKYGAVDTATALWRDIRASVVLLASSR